MTATADTPSDPSPPAFIEDRGDDTSLGQADNRQFLRRLLLTGLKSQRWTYAIAIVAMIVAALGATMTAWVMQGVVDAMSANKDRDDVIIVAATVAGIFMIKGIATYVQTVYMTRAGNRIVAMLQLQFYERLLSQSVSFFNINESSQLLQHTSRSAQNARQIIDLIVSSTVRDVLTLIGLVCVMFYQQPLLTVVSLVGGPIIMFGVRTILKSVRKIVAKETASLTAILKVTQETARGFQIIKLFGLEPTMGKVMKDAVEQVEDRSNAVARLNAITSPLVETLSGLVIAAVVLISAIDLVDGNPTTPGQLMSFITALLMAYEPAKRLTRMRVKIESLIVPLRLMFDLLFQPLTVEDAVNSKPLPDGPGEITLRNVHFAYRDAEPVLNGVSMTFQAGKTTAIVGASGSGKSSLMNLLMRLYDPTEGSVCVDGMDLRHVTTRSLHERLSFVGQDTFLFSTSVMNNLKLARKEATEEEIVAAAKAAHAHDFIMELPQGYDTEIGENGAFLSGGQRQRLSIARAFLRNGRILLLDEATSALDATSESLIKEALSRISQDATTVVIAHRLSTVMEADQIHVLDKGRIIQSGSPQDLLSRPGPFRAFFDQQNSTAAPEAG
ncbi:ABC transporter ATP-binding protein/permease [Pseudooceanicola sp. CBS1P-1]|uniref:ATP-binding cassette domain-containing protein n=1 Tax=Pseudooceanicola albus TaxID=2692189 RepID=A0A6L7G2U9_9RHOB|nr:MULTISPECIES: ABC transporter ATP-binding protein [Pseudooceanicola]MBT9385437.1 ABC transporter ATP-binding protein/permease [Pseudooceanicola endophyticus]MXN18704.1 ATP-binding cassette domain-containing protein [Pseudooceanicola albus]